MDSQLLLKLTVSANPRSALLLHYTTGMFWSTSHGKQLTTLNWSMEPAPGLDEAGGCYLKKVNRRGKLHSHRSPWTPLWRQLNTNSWTNSPLIPKFEANWEQWRKKQRGHVWSFIHVFNQPNHFLMDALFLSGYNYKHFRAAQVKG